MLQVSISGQLRAYFRGDEVFKQDSIGKGDNLWDSRRDVEYVGLKR